MTTNSSTAIFFANAPKLSELFALTLQIEHSDEQQNVGQGQQHSQKLHTGQLQLTQSRMSQVHTQFGQGIGRRNYSQPQIIRCRELIFTEPDIIGTPSLSHEKVLHIVLKQSLYNSGRLQARFKKMRLLADEPEQVTPALFNSCLRYTVEARLAPAWNRVGQYLVQGRDFLLSRQPLNAIKMDLTANEREFYLSVEAKIIKLPPIKLEDLEIPAPVCDRFTSHPDDVIQEYSIENNWCYVLPSMKQGKVVHVCHRLPSDGPFRSYRDIKRHWKNSYGYRLPDDENSVIYYQIYFKLIGEQLFTYPECCVRPRDIHILPRTDPKPILQAFLSDLQNKISNLCGQKFHFQTKASFLVTSLNEICKEGTNRSNLTTKMPVPTAGYRQAPPVAPVFQPKHSTGNAIQCSAVSASSQVNPYDVVSRSFGSASQSNVERIQDKAQLGQAENTKPTNRREDSPPSPQRFAPVTAESRPRIVPMFNSVKPASGIINTNRSIEKALPKTVPIFKPKAPSFGAKSAISSHKIQPFSQSFMSQPRTAEEPPRHVSSSTNPPSQDSGFESTCGSLTGLSARTSSIPSQLHFGGQSRSSNVPIFAKKTNMSSGQPVVKPQLQQPRLLGTGTMPGSKLKLKKLPTLTNSKAKQSMALPPLSVSPGGLLLNQGSSPSDSQSSQSRLHTVGHTPLKRLNIPTQKLEDGASKPKKPRAKQTVQEGMDVTLLANNNQLNKANAATLTAWLKGRGIQCKAKDKKTDIVEKVKLALNIVLTEP